MAPSDEKTVTDVSKKPEDVPAEDKTSVWKLVLLLIMLIITLAAYVNFGATILHMLETNGDRYIHGPDKELAQFLSKVIDLLENATCIDFNNGTSPVTMPRSTEMELRRTIEQGLNNYESSVITKNDDGWQPGHEITLVKDEWSYSRSVLFCASIITTVGYGDVVPKNQSGRIFTIFYSLIGVPLCLISITAIGLLLAKAIRFTVKMLFTVKVNPNTGQVVIPLKVSLSIMFGYLLLGAVLFRLLTKGQWDVLVSFYFCYITLTTIGLGDYVYGGEDQYEAVTAEDLVTTTTQSMMSTEHPQAPFDVHDEENRSAIFSVMYLLVGLSLVSMCFTLMQEQLAYLIRKFFTWCREKAWDLFINFLKKIFFCCKKGSKEKVPNPN